MREKLQIPSSLRAVGLSEPEAKAQGNSKVQNTNRAACSSLELGIEVCLELGFWGLVIPPRLDCEEVPKPNPQIPNNQITDDGVSLNLLDVGVWSLGFPRDSAVVLGAGLEPACLSEYAPQTYVSAIPPPERAIGR